MGSRIHGGRILRINGQRNNRRRILWKSIARRLPTGSAIRALENATVLHPRIDGKWVLRINGQDIDIVSGQTGTCGHPVPSAIDGLKDASSIRSRGVYCAGTLRIDGQGADPAAVR